MSILFAPGFMTDTDLWLDMYEGLREFGPYTHVNTSRDDTIEAMAARALASARPSFIMIGFSMGGYLAREIVRNAPDRITHLVLIATSARGDTPEQQSRKLIQARQAAATSFGGLSRSAIAFSLHSDRANDVALVERIQAMSQRLGTDVFQRQCLMKRSEDRDRLGIIRCPTLILAGEKDGVRTLAEAEELHAGIANSELVIIQGTGHMLPMEAPQRVAEVISSWLRKLSTDARAALICEK